MLYIVIAILMFGLLIAVHEFGHFFTAKLFGVKVNEFSIGMGPAIFKRQKGETLYSLRAFPIGGYCAMEGEDEVSSDPRAFGNLAAWKQAVVLVAGAGMNFLTGLLLILILFSQSSGFYRPTIESFIDGFGLENCGLESGDIVRSVNGHRVYYYGNLSFLLSQAGDEITWVVERGEEGKLYRVHTVMPLRAVEEDGQTVYRRGLMIGRVEDPATVWNILRYSWYGAMDFVRTVWMSLGMLVSGSVGVRDLSGPVGIVSTMSEVGSQSASVADAAQNLTYFAALIAVNLAVMNLLPLPALDGGRILFLLLNCLAYGLFKKKIDPKYEGYVHLAGMALLLGLSAVVMISDVGKLFGR